MKLLLDENIPARLKDDLNEFEVYTVFDKRWGAKKTES
jgi:predicted nuclease of predicted toxin-antitoxin system